MGPASYLDLFEHLLRYYRSERPNQPISNGDLEVLLLIFPAILVNRSDNFVDTQEMNYLQKLTKEVANNFGITTSPNLKRELRYLTRDTNFWKQPFLRTLKAYVTERPEVAGHLVDIMVMAASSSSGDLLQNLSLRAAKHNLQERPTAMPSFDEEIDFIDEDEKRAIRDIARALDLYNDKSAAQKLSVQLN